MPDLLMKKKALKTSGERFYFDKNIFDDDYVDPKDIEDEPPPPVFSQQELEAAKNESFERGRQHGLKESAESREQHLAQLLGKITQDMDALLKAEGAREKIYEEESMRLAVALLTKLFPTLNEKHGFEELKAMVADTLQKRGGQSELLIEVAPDNVEGIKAHLDQTTGPQGENIRYKLKGDESLAADGCRISWEDGGAIRDSQALAAEIGAILEEALAASERRGHDSVDNTASQPVAEDASKEAE